NDVWLYSGVLDGPHLSGAPGAGLHFIGHQQNAVLIADAPQLLQELGGSDNVSALALHRLNEDCGNLLRRQRGLEKLFFDETGAIYGVLLGIAAFRTPIEVRIGNMSYARNQGKEAAALLRLGGGERERAHGASVEGAVEGDHILALGVIARQLERGLDGLSSAVAVVKLVRAFHRREP